MTYNPGGNYAAIAAVLVLIVNHFFPGLGITNDQIIQTIADVVGLVGAIYAYFAHRSLAISTGAYHPRS